MRSRRLGTNGPIVPAIGLGCIGMTDHYGCRDDAVQAIATIHRALKQRPGEAILNTKVGQVRYPDGVSGTNSRPDHVQLNCEANLKRLGMEVIDIYTQHPIDPEAPIEETMGALSRLVDAGKVRYIGLSEAGPGTIRKAHATHSFVCIETEYLIWSRDVEEVILPLCRESGTSLMPDAPLG